MRLYAAIFGNLQGNLARSSFINQCSTSSLCAAPTGSQGLNAAFHLCAMPHPPTGGRVVASLCDCYDQCSAAVIHLCAALFTHRGTRCCSGMPCPRATSLTAWRCTPHAPRTLARNGRPPNGYTPGSMAGNSLQKRTSPTPATLLGWELGLQASNLWQLGLRPTVIFI